MKSAGFQVDRRVRDLGVLAQAVVARGLEVKRTDPQLEALKAETVARIRARWTGEDLSANRCLAGFRDLYARVGKRADRLTPSAEYLVRYVLEKGRFAPINTCVDAYNIVSAASLLALGAHDRDKMQGGMRLVLTAGGEPFSPLGADLTTTLDKGEYAYMDETDVLCRLDIRQGQKTKITRKTTTAAFIVQGNRETTEDEVADTVQHLIRLVKRFCGGTFEVLENVSVNP